MSAILSIDHPSAAYLTAGIAAAERPFTRRFPAFDPDGSFAAMRRCEYGRLDAEQHAYLDYSGGSLYAASQIETHAQLLRRGVFGNPHSTNPTSLAATALVADARQAVLEFFGAPPDEYHCVLTANATGALKLVGEAYPFAPGGSFALMTDNHNSVNGIREFARQKGAAVAYVPVIAPELRVDRSALTDVLFKADASRSNLLAFPAQSNFSGVQHPLDIIDEAHRCGWEVLLDAAAFAPTNPLDISRTRPDFVAASFYKIIGYPTGVGCLLVRRDRMRTLTRPWFAGGTVTIASVRGDGHYLRPDEGGFEDGTVNYLSLPAVADGLRRIQGLGIAKIHERVASLTQWLLEAMAGLLHRNGRHVVSIYGPTGTDHRGGTVAFTVRDCDGRVVCERHIEELANRANISLRTGCFCNPGAGETANHLKADEMATWFGRAEPVWPDELRDGLLRQHDRVLSAVRVSLGIASNFADVYRFACFLQNFADRTADEIAVAQNLGGSPPAAATQVTANAPVS
jgi:molybdenum cofactor sulfurtransferase